MKKLHLQKKSEKEKELERELKHEAKMQELKQQRETLDFRCETSRAILKDKKYIKLLIQGFEKTKKLKKSHILKSVVIGKN